MQYTKYTQIEVASKLNIHDLFDNLRLRVPVESCAEAGIICTKDDFRNVIILLLLPARSLNQLT